MDLHQAIRAVSIIAISASIALSSASAGELNPPPGAPSPTMKTLDEVEPRTPIGVLPFTISQSGSYYLTGNLTGVAGQHGITINADGVTLDLNGFTITGDPASMDGIGMPSFRQDITIRNGGVAGWPGNGVSARIDNGLVENLIVRECGAGIDSAFGFQISILHCAALENLGIGIFGNDSSQITGCTARLNGGSGIHVDSGVVTGCASSENGGDGISAVVDSVVLGCTSSENSGSGISVDSRCVVRDNQCSLNSTGIYIFTERNRVEENNVTANTDVGIRAPAGTSINNLIIRNTASANVTLDYSIAVGNSVGPIVNVAGLGDISGVTGSEHPWANFVY